MNIQKFAMLPISCLAFAFLSACNLHLVSDYDPELDKGVTDVQIQVEKIFQKLRNCAHNAKQTCVDPSKTFDVKDYSKLQIKLNVIELRAEANEVDQRSSKQIEVLKQALLEDSALTVSKSATTDQKSSQIQSLEARHRLNDPMDMEDIKVAQALINTHIRAILTYELAKKSGTAKEN